MGYRLKIALCHELPTFILGLHRWDYVAMHGQMRSHAGVHCRIAGLPRRKSIDIAVVHAECGGNQHGVVNFEVGCAKLSCALHAL
jgi:hypothetical protein